MDINKIKIIPLLDTLKLEKIDDAIYFSKKYSEYISNSRLSLINPEQDGDPKTFFEGLNKHNIYSDSLVLGSAVHEICLQPELFELCINCNRPSAKCGIMADELYKYYLNDEISEEIIIEISNKVNYYKGKMTSDKIETLFDKCSAYWKNRKEFEEQNTSSKTLVYLDDNLGNKALACIDAINKNKNIQNLLHPSGLIEDPISENEQTILLDVQIESPYSKPFILKLKSKLDNYTINIETGIITVNDIKTIGKILPEFNNNVNKFHYKRELGMYMFLLQLCAKKYYGIENSTCKGNFLVVSTIPKYYTKVVSMTKKDFISGFFEFKYLLKLVAYYYLQGYRFL